MLRFIIWSGYDRYIQPKERFNVWKGGKVIQLNFFCTTGLADRKNNQGRPGRRQERRPDRKDEQTDRQADRCVYK